MKVETQANHLEKMMLAHKLYPEYELALPLCEVKSAALKKLAVGDVFLLGLPHLEFILLDAGHLCASAVADGDKKAHTLKISYLHKDTLQQDYTKKYKVLKCSFGLLQSRQMEVGHKVGIGQLDLQEVKLFVDDVNIAEGSLVKVDEEIAVEITKVKI